MRTRRRRRAVIGDVRGRVRIDAQMPLRGTPAVLARPSTQNTVHNDEEDQRAEER